LGISSEMYGWLGLLFLIILLFSRVPVAYTFAIVGFLGYWIVGGIDQALAIVGTTFHSTVGAYSFSVVPLFILMGYFASQAGIITSLYETAKKWIGHIPGGLAQATILGGAGFGAASGSGFASTATLSKITIPEMVKAGVDRKLAYGVVASAGPLAQMIPPSVLMIMYAIVAEESVSKLLIGGILPGVLTAVVYMVLVAIRVKINPELAPSMKKEPLKERVSSLKSVWGFLLLVLVIICGIYTGIFTPTEAGSIGAFVAMLMAFFKKGLNKKTFGNSLIETVKTTSMVFFIVGTSFVFGYFLGITRLPTNISEFVTELPVSPMVIILGIILMYLFIGMFVDMIAAMFLTLPIILPAITDLGFDPLWFGVLLVFLCEVALVTPPLGMSLFIIKGSVPKSDMKEIIQGSLPFIVADFVVIALLIIFPQIITFLPSLMD